MSVKVRHGGALILAVAAGATLVQTSTFGSVALAAGNRTLNLRVPRSSDGTGSGFDADAAAVGRGGAWAVAGEGVQALRAAHALTGDSASSRGGVASGGQVVVVSLTVGRRPRQRYLTNAVAVGDLIAATGVKVRRADIVRPAVDAILRPGQAVRVIRVRNVRTTETITLPFRTLIQYSKELEPGQVKIVAAGAEGSALATYLITYRNGRESGRVLVSQQVTVAPVDRVEQHGPQSLGSGSESGGASWYDWSGCGDGYHAAHKTLPFGTSVMVTNLDNGKSVTVTINDRGPYIDGRIIDLCPTAFSAIAPLGQGVAQVEITW